MTDSAVLCTVNKLFIGVRALGGGAGSAPGQTQRESGAAEAASGDLHGSPIGLHDLVCHRQSDAMARDVLVGAPAAGENP